MNSIDRRIADRDALLRMTLGGDRYANAAMDRGDDLALLRRIAKAEITDARALAADRAAMRGHARHYIAKALGITPEDVRLLTHPIWALDTGQTSDAS